MREREVGGVIKNGERDAATICEHKSEMPLGEERLFISGLLNHWRMDINLDWSTDRQTKTETDKQWKRQTDKERNWQWKRQTIRETDWQYKKYNNRDRRWNIDRKIDIKPYA